MQINLNMVAVRNLLDQLLDNKPPESKPLPKLTDVVEQARREWLAAQSYYDAVTDKDLVDHAVYLMQAAEKKYMYLLKQARQMGVTHSPYLPEMSHEDTERVIENKPN
ncbi:hypothetical protein SDC9_101205 [bioreactor metagenome]|uniref:DUF2508 domain-containing protein n=1 Tax=bioreactor metagenome TaxID=1076179 RepID=A0A645AN13_9ZZZZ